MPSPPGHCCDDVAARAALVYHASRIATERIGNPALNGDRWTKVFASVIEQMAKPLLNRSNNGSGRERQTVDNIESNGGPVHDAGNVSDASSGSRDAFTKLPKP